MTQTPFVGAPQGAIWGYDPTTKLWLPIGASPEVIAASGEEYGSMLVWVTNVNANGQATMQFSAPVALASDQPPIKAKGDFLEQIGLTSGALNADLVPSFDVSPYKWIALQVTGTWSGTLNFQGSNDNVNFSTYAVYAAPGTAGSQTNITVNGIYGLAVQFHYFRCRMLAYTSGAANGVADFFGFPPQLLSLNANATESGTWTMQPGNTANTTPWLVSGSNNNFVQAAGGGLTVGKASPGLLVGAIVTATGTVGLTVYDNASAASGTPLLVIPANPAVGQQFPVNGWAKNGITSGGVANCPGVTFFFS